MKSVRVMALLLVLAHKVFASQNYTLADLEILHSQNSFDEYFSHFLDIRPSQRNDKWQSMTLEMANKLLVASKAKGPIDQKVYSKILKINTQSILKNDDFFQLQLAKFSEKYFSNCLNKVQCEKHLIEYWSNSRRFEEVDTKIFISSKVISQKFSVNILKDIINSKSGSFACRKEELQNEISLLILQAITVSNDCIKEMRSFLITKIKSYKNNDSRSKIIKSLIEANAFEAESKAYSLVLYLLNDPNEGDVLNYAWSELSSLSQNYALRKNVLDKLIETEPFPDIILRKKDIKQRDVIINYINKNFPEYFQTYARECVAFYEGTKKFPRGIPAINCDFFFEIGKNKDWISQSLITRYLKAKKI